MLYVRWKTVHLLHFPIQKLNVQTQHWEHRMSVASFWLQTSPTPTSQLKRNCCQQPSTSAHKCIAILLSASTNTPIPAYELKTSITFVCPCNNHCRPTQCSNEFHRNAKGIWKKVVRSVFSHNGSECTNASLATSNSRSTL